MDDPWLRVARFALVGRPTVEGKSCFQDLQVSDEVRCRYNARTMFGPLGLPEVLIILGIALVIFGPRRLPEMGKTLGRALGEFRRATTDLKRSVQFEMDAEDDRQREDRLGKERELRQEERSDSKPQSAAKALPEAAIEAPAPVVDDSAPVPDLAQPASQGSTNESEASAASEESQASSDAE